MAPHEKDQPIKSHTECPHHQPTSPPQPLTHPPSCGLILPYTATIHHGALPSPASLRAYADFTTSIRPFLNVDNAAVDAATRKQLLALARAASATTMELVLDTASLQHPPPAKFEPAILVERVGRDAAADVSTVPCAQRQTSPGRAARAARRAARKEELEKKG